MIKEELPERNKAQLEFAEFIMPFAEKYKDIFDEFYDKKGSFQKDMSFYFMNVMNCRPHDPVKYNFKRVIKD